MKRKETGTLVKQKAIFHHFSFFRVVSLLFACPETTQKKGDKAKKRGKSA
jgi:hypothetical protein